MKYLMGCTLLLITMLSAKAQTATPPRIVLQPVAQVAFPQEVYLEVGIPLPASEVRSVTLTYVLPNAEPVTVAYPQQAAYFFADEYVVATRVVELSADNPPPLFAEIRYRWEVLTSTGARVVTDGTVIYQDTRTRWAQPKNTADVLQFFIGQGISITPEQLAARFAPIVNRLGQELGELAPQRYLLYPPALPIGCDVDEEGAPVIAFRRQNVTSTVPCDLDMALRVFARDGYITRQPANVTDFVNAELSGVVGSAYRFAWADVPVPAWFESGILQMYVVPARDDFGRVQQRDRAGQLLTLSQLATLPDDPAAVDYFRSQARIMLVYLLDTFGVERVFTLARTIAEYPTFNDAYATVLGQEATALLPTLQTWIYTSPAVAASAYRIFSETTPTPTATWTATPTRVPPTQTATPTATVDASATPLPTRTRIPPTATITPLPAQGFVVRSTLATMPVPTLVANAASPQTLILVVGAGLVLILLAIAVRISRQGNRRS